MIPGLGIAIFVNNIAVLAQPRHTDKNYADTVRLLLARPGQRWVGSRRRLAEARALLYRRLSESIRSPATGGLAGRIAPLRVKAREDSIDFCMHFFGGHTWPGLGLAGVEVGRYFSKRGAGRIEHI